MNYPLCVLQIVFVVFGGIRKQFDGLATILRRCKSSPPNVEFVKAPATSQA